LKKAYHISGEKIKFSGENEMVEAAANRYNESNQFFVCIKGGSDYA
jgi:hypothetical protein